MGKHHQLGQGYFYEDLAVGDTLSTNARTITEADLVAFCNLTWFTEELFTNLHDRQATAIAGRVVPGALVFTFAEGLIMPAIQHTGLAFLDAGMSIKGPTFVGDTIRVEVEITEMRPTSKPGRGLIRTVNRVRNQHGNVVQEYTPLRLLARRG
ncbi:MAG: MaoC family dehydratase N-terminal domain-containing protein [Burkholderiales bacterium]|nr:MaoC family dehydratase N-terminal domain-containing protein [Burkholderiales bacterium]